MQGGSQRYRWVRSVQWSREPLCLLSLSWTGPPYCSSTLFYHLVSIALQHPTALHCCRWTLLWFGKLYTLSDIYFDLNQNHVVTKTIEKMLLREKAFVCECVRSNISFRPRNQDVDFDLLKMSFSFPWAKYDENRWLNIKLVFKKKRDIIAANRQCVYFALLWHTVYCCVIQWLVTSDGSDGTQNDPGDDFSSV